MSEESDLERTEEATPRRLEKAREEGQVVRSQELTSFTLLMAAAVGILMLGSALMEKLVKIMQSGMQLDRELAFQSELMINRFYEFAIEGLISIGPLLFLLLIVAFFAPMLLSGWLVSAKAVIPDFKRIDPIKGFVRIFSMRSLIELIKAILKTILIGGVAALVIWHNKDSVMALLTVSIDLGISRTGDFLAMSFLLIISAMIIIVAVDVPFQIWEHAKQLRMTQEEVRKEYKESEGDPYVKARIRNLQREAARRRMMSEIPKADVIVTNPTHYAVALRYQSNMRAPKVVAKGVHLLAARIREIATEHRIPILEAPPLARALYHHTELESEIPEKLYTAVAEVLAYVFQLRRYNEYGGAEPRPPVDVPVPDELDQAKLAV
ncbi:flagellar biosynthesis protein FlhB [Nitrosomonas ureae]|uniref:Flagellar biosynthetic protein FlhB n=2 Tax=Pseudomonadota TaxID=1224 RepID=A0A1H9EH03_9PROT|nr:flagellar biosynthesis protein FlhB [Nitrosomonas ureae]PTQ80460.1 flagellar biosynthetic protein FlhB [Nitrosomonas ureae]PXX15545.1 flagellar biosynthetic protein FlhB [Nitrosomonas ureae]SEQ24994.1 flagellar biosynthetic protein FlhB [Nitrosomonas ureae]SOD21150.1 flagellar biosynthetic protein FlhB [Nitrosomonas ureae]